LTDGAGGNAHNAGFLLLPAVREDLSVDAVDLLNGAAGDDWLILLLTEDEAAGRAEAVN